jgi:hypothetical protein
MDPGSLFDYCATCGVEFGECAHPNSDEQEMFLRGQNALIIAGMALRYED